jgi:hypothetical protein
VLIVAGAGGGVPLPGQATINAVPGKQYDITISASGITSFNGMEVKLAYDPAVFDIADLCVFTKTKETATGQIAAAGITVTQVSAGQIKFTVNKTVPTGSQWAGALTTVRLKAKAAAANTVISVQY